MIGITSSSLQGHEGRSPVDTLDAARAAGFGAVMFANLSEVSPDMNAEALRQLRREADARDMGLGFGVGSFNPSKPERNRRLAELGGGDVTAGFSRAIEGARILGAETLFFVIGMIEDRTDPQKPWSGQLASVTEALVGLRAQARDAGVQLLLKTHEELTTFEAVRIVEAVGEDVLGISHDPVNLVCRIEDPVMGTGRVARFVRQVHLEDAIVTFDGEQMRRYLAPMGEGDMDWPRMLDLIGDVPMWLEFHRGQFAMPVFDQDWLAAQPDLTLDEYRAVIGTAVRRFRLGTPPSDQANPYDRMQAAIAWLKANTN